MRQTHPREWLETLARLGYAARGVVYLIVGGFAWLDAWDSGESHNSKGALVQLLNEPFGETLLAVVALGLTGFAVWRFLQAVLDADHQGHTAKGLAVRVGFLVSALTHVGLTLFALSLLFDWGAGGSGGGHGVQDWTARLLSQQYGQWLVGVLGGIVIGVGVAQSVKAWKATFNRYLTWDQQQQRWGKPLCRFGLVARGVVFIIIGIFLITAALHFSAGEARGLSGALNALEAQPYGAFLLGVVALGLIAFAVYNFIQAFYRRIHPPERMPAVPHLVR